MAADSTETAIRPAQPETAIAISPAPDPRDAAAIAAALQRFQADTTIAPAAGPERVDPWLRAALEDGVLSARSFGPADPF